MASITQETLQKLSLFQGLQSSTYAALMDIGRVETYKSGEHLFREKDELCCFYIILSGTVSLYKTNSNGQQKTIFILGKDTLLNETLFDPIPASISCKIHEDCKVLVFYRTDLIRLFQQDFRLVQNILVNALDVYIASLRILHPSLRSRRNLLLNFGSLLKTTACLMKREP